MMAFACSVLVETAACFLPVAGKFSVLDLGGRRFGLVSWRTHC